MAKSKNNSQKKAPKVASYNMKNNYMNEYDVKTTRKSAGLPLKQKSLSK